MTKFKDIFENVTFTFEAKLNFMYNINVNPEVLENKLDNLSLLKKATDSFVNECISDVAFINKEECIFEISFKNEKLDTLIVEPLTFSVYAKNQMNNETQKMIKLVYDSTIGDLIRSKFDKETLLKVISQYDNVVEFKKK